MSRRALASPLALSLALLAVSVPAHAGPSQPPPPPTTPVCGYCKGPPPPPTLVPTAPAPVLPVQTPVISVKISPARVHRGHPVKLTVATAPKSSLTVDVHYHSGQPSTYRAKTDGKGAAQLRWKVPTTASLGKATARITARSSGKFQLLSVAFTVLK